MNYNNKLKLKQKKPKVKWWANPKNSLKTDKIGCKALSLRC
jgi:hypothetical protein